MVPIRKNSMKGKRIRENNVTETNFHCRFNEDHAFIVPVQLRSVYSSSSKIFYRKELQISRTSVTWEMVSWALVPAPNLKWHSVIYQVDFLWNYFSKKRICKVTCNVFPSDPALIQHKTFFFLVSQTMFQYQSCTCRFEISYLSLNMIVKEDSWNVESQPICARNEAVSEMKSELRKTKPNHSLHRNMLAVF